MRALFFRDYGDVESLVASNPSWAVRDAMRAASMQRASARMAAGVPCEHAHGLGVIERGKDLGGNE